MQGVDKLPDDHDGGVAGVVVHVVEPGFDGLTADRGQDFQIVARAGNGLADDVEVQGGHLRGKDGVRLAHRPGEHRTEGGSGGPGSGRRFAPAASRERIRMRAAPRDAPSSILMSVCSFPALVRSSDT